MLFLVSEFFSKPLSVFTLEAVKFSFEGIKTLLSRQRGMMWAEASLSEDYD